MKVHEFTRCTLKELEDATGIAFSRWSLYFRGLKGMSEHTINKASRSLGMSPDEFLWAVEQRRKEQFARKQKANTTKVALTKG